MHILAITGAPWIWTWWGAVVLINVINLIIGITIYVKSKNNEKVKSSPYRKRLLIFGLIFIGVAFYRSIFVSSYLEQLAWFDTLANSSLLIRFFALFAEVSFAYLIMNVLLNLNKEVPAKESDKSKPFLRFIETKTPYVFFISLCLAQFFAFGGTINKIQLLFAIEETLWGLAFLSITPLIIIQLKRVYSFKEETIKKELKMYRIFTVFMTVFCVGYSLYSVLYHLPIEQWPLGIEQLQMAIPEPAIRTGFSAIRDAFSIVNVSRDYSAWGGIGFIIWHSGYFTLCGWMVLFFMTGPRRLITI
ncbi:hypothetical protein RJI07_03335 [Mycoplasmatota bacterium WC30]